MHPTPESVLSSVDRLYDRAGHAEQISIIEALKDALDEYRCTIDERRANLVEGLEFDIITHPSVVSWVY